MTPSTLDCHCTEGVGDPDAVALNVADLLRQIVVSTGSVKTAGATFKVTTTVPDAVPVQLASTTFVTE
jgi:hypothetical protein